MTATTSTHFVFSEDELALIASHARIESLPVALGLRVRHGTEAELRTAMRAAQTALRDRGLSRDGELPGELVAMLRALQRPDRELTMRVVTRDGTARIVVVRHGVLCVAARRVGDVIVLGSVDGPADLSAATRTLLSQLPAASPAAIDPVGAPLDRLGEALSHTHDPLAIADRVRALGASARAATALGAALGSRQAFAEIVYYTLAPDEDRISRCAGAVAVFYTKRGRIVGAPSASPSGQLWSTLKGGSDHAIKQAVRQLVELSASRWEES